MYHDNKRSSLLRGKSNQAFNEPKELPFFYFDMEKFAFALEVIFYVNIPTALLIYNLTVMMSLENLPVIHKLILNSKGKISTTRVLKFRIIATMLVFAIGFFPLNEYFIIILAGSLLGPIIFFLIPVNIIIKDL